MSNDDKYPDSSSDEIAPIRRRKRRVADEPAPRQKQRRIAGPRAPVCGDVLMVVDDNGDHSYATVKGLNPDDSTYICIQWFYMQSQIPENAHVSLDESDGEGVPVFATNHHDTINTDRILAYDAVIHKIGYYDINGPSEPREPFMQLVFGGVDDTNEIGLAVRAAQCGANLTHYKRTVRMIADGRLTELEHTEAKIPGTCSACRLVRTLSLRAMPLGTVGSICGERLSRIIRIHRAYTEGNTDEAESMAMSLREYCASEENKKC